MNAKTIGELEAELGEQLKALRLRKNLDRATLAERSGCSVSAIKSLEGGNGSTLKTLVAVARALGREEWLTHIAPQVTISPLSLTRTSELRQRARSPKPQ
jgi:transcriptional regulator with XRE-family HTH domain